LKQSLIKTCSRQNQNFQTESNKLTKASINFTPEKPKFIVSPTADANLFLVLSILSPFHKQVLKKNIFKKADKFFEKKLVA